MLVLKHKEGDIIEMEFPTENGTIACGYIQILTARHGTMQFGYQFPRSIKVHVKKDNRKKSKVDRNKNRKRD